jgi:hypothetical protein
LLAEALKGRWPIPKKLRPKVIRRLAEVVEDTASSPREVTTAATALLNADRINLEAIGMAIKVREHEELTERVAELERIASREKES